MTIKDIQKHLNTDAVIIFRNNQFIGQDVLNEENKILELTGFDGSAGTLVVTRNMAYLFVDGRYEIQSKQQTNPKQVNVIVESEQCNLFAWLKENLGEASIAYNPWQISESRLKKLQRILPKADFVAKPQIMPVKKATAFEQEVKYAGKSANAKVKEIAKFVTQNDVDAVLISSADSVSWLLNLRSNALPQTPVVRAMALVNAKKEVFLFADNLELPKNCSIKNFSLSNVETILLQKKISKIAVDYKTTPAFIVDICENLKIRAVNKTDPCIGAKAEKNRTELKGMVNAHIKDGIAMCKFLAWFEKNYKGKTEIDIAKKLFEFRKKQPLFFSLSFGTIAGSAENAAIIHYQPKEKSCAKIKENSVLLLDSGGQYLDGTTDITRTIAVGKPSKDMIEKFTLVLKAHIALAAQKFPGNTSGTRLDAICRSVMWRYGLDYKHGTGHGVGCFLNVHEGPQSISIFGDDYPLKENMVVSIEPGYYEEGNFGIRIENLVYVKKSNSDNFLNFVPLTVVPIDFRLIDKYLLDDREIKWLNAYHKNVYKIIAPHLNKHEQEWLQKACSPL